MTTGMTTWKKTICPYDCPASCGLLVETDGKRILRTKGDPKHPMTGGLICKKMQRYEDSIHAPERILTPLKRVGKKGEGRFVPVSWEEALGEITGRWKQILSEYGGDAILPVYYSGVMSVVQRKCVDALFNKMNACRLVKTLCSSAKGAGYKSVVGNTGCLDPRELALSDLILVWGSNVKATRIHTMPVLKQVRAQGRRVILIEACGVDTASYCDETILIRPGTDGALALAMMHVLDREGLADEQFLRERALGYEEFRRTLPQYTPQWAEQVTGIPEKRIEALAREFASVKAPAILLGSGPSRYGNGGMTTRLILILSAFTGAWGRPGGGYCGSNPSGVSYVDDTRVTRPDFRTKAGASVNLNLLGEALERRPEGQAPGGSQTESRKEERGQEPDGASAAAPVIRALYVCGSNPLNSVANQTAMKRGLEREDLFTVVHERFLSDTAKYADFILPATFSVEQPDVIDAYGYCTFGSMKKIIEPAGQCRSNWNTVCALAKAMGYEDDHFRQTEEEMVDQLLSHPGAGLAGISDEERQILREGGVVSLPFADHGAFRTPSGKFQIVDETQPDPVPCYRESYGGSQPLRLVSVPDCDTLNSIFLEREALVKHRGAMRLWMHPRDGAARGISDGDLVTAWNDLAEVQFEARLTDLVAPGTVAASGIYTSGITGQRWQVNALHHGRLSDIGAATTMNDNAVEVRRANGTNPSI